MCGEEESGPFQLTLYVEEIGHIWAQFDQFFKFDRS